VRRLPPGLIRLLSALLICASLITIDALGWIGGRHFIHIIFTPIERLAHALRNIQKTQDELTESANQSPPQKIPFTTEELVKENALLKKMLGLSYSLPYTLLPANVVSSSVQLGEHFLVIDKGYWNGCQNGQTVVCGEYFLGKIDQVSANSSLVELLGSNALHISVYLPRSGFQGILRPCSDDELEIYYLPTRAAIQEGDLVYTSGLGGEFPRGLLVGEVGLVKSIPGELFLDCRLSPRPELFSSTIVAVLLSAQYPHPPLPTETVPLDFGGELELNEVIVYEQEEVSPISVDEGEEEESPGFEITPPKSSDTQQETPSIAEEPPPPSPPPSPQPMEEER